MTENVARLCGPGGTVGPCDVTAKDICEDEAHYISFDPITIVDGVLTVQSWGVPDVICLVGGSTTVIDLKKSYVINYVELFSTHHDRVEDYEISVSDSITSQSRTSCSNGVKTRCATTGYGTHQTLVCDAGARGRYLCIQNAIKYMIITEVRVFALGRLPPCPVGMYRLDNECVFCPRYMSSPSFSLSIASCVCELGSVNVDSTTCQCDAGWSGAMGHCARCVAGTFQPLPSVAACTACAAGKFSGGTAAGCDTCESGSYSSSDRSQCLLCPTNRLSLSMGGDISACVCQTGWSLTNGECTPCAAGTFKDFIGNSTCTACAAGKISAVVGAANNTCTDCPVGSYSADNRSKCEQCRANSYSALRSSDIYFCICNSGWSGRNGDCVACVVGKQWSTITESVYRPAGGYRNVDFFTCRDCDAGKYKPTPGPGVCTDCEVGGYSAAAAVNRTDCVCLAGWTGPSGDCVGCVAGNYKPAPGPVACTICAHGKFSGLVKAITDGCAACAAGWYPAADQSQCVVCPANSGSALEIASVSECYCKVAWHGEDNANCTACVAGKYKSSYGSEACPNCTAGNISAAMTVTCVGCGANSYSKNMNTECASCPRNSGSLAAVGAISGCACDAGWSGTNDNCTGCAPGKYKPSPGSEACTACSGGSYSRASAISCTPCEADSYSTGDRSRCYVCPLNSGSAVGSDAVAACSCNAGWSGINMNCVACAPGKYKSGHGSEACASCGAGKVSDAEAYWCTACAAGSYAADNNSFCRSCLPNTDSVAGSADVSACVCNTGWSDMNGNCTHYTPPPPCTYANVTQMCGLGRRPASVRLLLWTALVHTVYWTV